MSDGLTPLDATFLELEEADEAAHMHMGSLLIFEAREGLPPTLQRVRRRIERRVGVLPHYTCRLSETHTGGLHWPSWIEDADFDVAAHVEEVALPASHDDAALEDWAAGYWSERLDRRRPLWDARLVTGLEGGRWAIATKTHHALADGVASVAAVDALLDSSRTGRRRRRAPAQPAAAPVGGRPLRTVTRAARGTLYAARHPGRLRDAFLQAKAMAEVALRDEIVAAPRCSLNVPLSPARRFRVVRADLAEVKRIEAALGGTVNDVMLAAVAGGLRTLLSARGEDVSAPGLRAMVPVSLRAGGERSGAGNEVSSLFVHLPVMEPDAGHRYLLVAAQTSELKQGGLAGGAAGLISIAGLAPPIVHSLVARSTFAARLFNLTVTNVPGPQRPLYAFGARMEEVWPLVPLAADHSVGVAVVSYDGELFCGLNADANVGPDLELLAAGVEAAIAELGDLASTGHALPALG